MTDVKLSNLTIWGWLVLLPTIGVVALSAFQIASWIPEEWNREASAVKKLLALPAVGVSVLFYTLCSWALSRVGLQVFRRPSQSEPVRRLSLVCEECGSNDLGASSTPSMLDGRTGWKCKVCGNTMGPRRSKVFLAFVLALSGFLTAGCIPPLVGIAFGSVRRESLFILLGPAVIGLVVFVATLKARRGPMPKLVKHSAQTADFAEPTASAGQPREVCSPHPTSPSA
jgi:hypothetical protein